MDNPWCLLIILVTIGDIANGNQDDSGSIYKIQLSSKGGICVCGSSMDDVIASVNKIKNESSTPPSTPQSPCQGGSPKDCGDLPKSCPSGQYKIYPQNATGFDVFCEMTKYGGGWTVFQRRENGVINFLRGWNDYKTGFGDINHEFWLGNDNIHSIASKGGYQLLVELTDYDGHTALARYRQFMVGSESTNYKLSVSMYSGNAGDSLSTQNEMAFTTKDRDNDLAGDNCAIRHPGAWWYKHCMTSDLNGEYFYTKNPRGSWNGIHWNGWKGKDYSLKGSQMMMRIF